MINEQNQNTGQENLLMYSIGVIMSVISKLLEMDFFITIILALICGFVSIIGKHAGTYAWEQFKEKFLTKKTSAK